MTISEIRSLTLPLGVGFFFAFFSSSSFSEELNINEIDPIVLNQIIFEDAISLINEGRFDEASEILANLYKSTQEKRVKLEWARSLYLGGRKQEADKLFKEVNEDNPPMMVQEKIDIFRNDIAISRGKIDATVGMIYDTNPRAISGDHVINLFGSIFDYKVGYSKKPQVGLNYAMAFEKGFDDKNKLVATFLVNGNQFSDSAFNKTKINESILYKFPDIPALEVSASYEQFIYAEKLLYTSPSLTLKHTVELGRQSYWKNEFSYSSIKYPDYQYFSGPMYGVRSIYSQSINEKLFIEGFIGFEKSKSEEASYSFDSRSIGFGHTFLVPEYYLKGQVKLFASTRSYEKPDPIFGLVRKDNNYNVSIGLNKTNLNLFGMQPVVEMMYERNNSDIGIYSYKRAILSLNLNRIF